MDEVNCVVEGTNWVALVASGSVIIGSLLVFSIWIYLRYRTRADLQSTVRAAIERGQELTPEFLRLLGQTSRPSREADLRRGIITLAAGVGLIVLALLRGDQDFTESVSAVGVLVAIIGIGILALWRFGHGSQR